MVTTGLGLGVGIAVGFLAGRLYQVAVRAWKDYRDTKAHVPVLFTAAVAATRSAVGAVVMAAIVAGVALYAASNQ